jgi:ABC-2 type transport system ATP-binding protein
MIEIRNLTKRFGSFTAVDGVSFDVDRGEVLGFLGPNGAGKSTTMKMLTGFLHPTSGTAKVCGHDILEDSLAAKKVLGYLPEGAPLYPDMTPRGFLEFIAEVRGFSGADAARRVDEVIGKVNLASVAHQRIETLSKGFKRRVGLAQAILHDPEVLVLDEPTDGLDPNQKHEVRNLIRAMAKEKVIVLSTHILEEVEAVCTRSIIIARGKVVIDCTPAELAARSRYHNAVTVTVESAMSTAVRQGLAALDGVQTVEDLPSREGAARFVLIPKARRSIAVEVGQKARDSRWEIGRAHV